MDLDTLLSTADQLYTQQQQQHATASASGLKHRVGHLWAYLERMWAHSLHTENPKMKRFSDISDLSTSSDEHPCGAFTMEDGWHGMDQERQVLVAEDLEGKDQQEMELDRSESTLALDRTHCDSDASLGEDGYARAHGTTSRGPDADQDGQKDREGYLASEEVSLELPAIDGEAPQSETKGLQSQVHAGAADGGQEHENVENAEPEVLEEQPPEEQAQPEEQQESTPIGTASSTQTLHEKETAESLVLSSQATLVSCSQNTLHEAAQADFESLKVVADLANLAMDDFDKQRDHSDIEHDDQGDKEEQPVKQNVKQLALQLKGLQFRPPGPGALPVLPRDKLKQQQRQHPHEEDMQVKKKSNDVGNQSAGTLNKFSRPQGPRKRRPPTKQPVVLE